MKRDAGTDMLPNRVFAIETDSNVVYRSRQSTNWNDLLKEMGVDAKLGNVRAICRIINRGIITRGCGPITDIVVPFTTLCYRELLAADGKTVP